MIPVSVCIQRGPLMLEQRTYRLLITTRHVESLQILQVSFQIKPDNISRVFYSTDPYTVKVPYFGLYPDGYKGVLADLVQWYVEHYLKRINKIIPVGIDAVCHMRTHPSKIRATFVHYGSSYASTEIYS